MLLTFKGRKSGRIFTTPVRYLRHEGKIRCFTASSNQWWRNLRGGTDVSLRVGGRDVQCHAEAIADDPRRIRPALEDFLSQFPQDAAYYNVQLDDRRRGLASDLDQAATRTVMVEASPYPEHAV